MMVTLKVSQWKLVLLLEFLFVIFGSAGLANSSSFQELKPTAEQGTTSDPVPMLVKFTGTTADSQGKASAGIVSITFAIYEKSDSTAPLWLETQSINTDESGHYTVLLGSSKSQGLPMDLFTSGQARWLGVQIEGTAEQQPRTLLVSVPYALKAGDAETLGGKPLSAFLLTDSKTATGTKSQRLQESTRAQPEATAAVDNGGVSGTPNFITKWTSATNIGNSLLFDDGTHVGIGTQAPSFTLDLANSDATPTGANLMRIQTPSVDGARINFVSNSANGRNWAFGSNFIVGAGEFGIYDYTANANRFLISSSGRIGMGTSFPGFQLDVQNSDTSLAGSNLLGLRSPSIGGAILHLTSTSANGRHFGLGTNFITGSGEFGVYDYTAGTSRFLISSTGNIGVGTASPSFQLDIQNTDTGPAGANLFRIQSPSTYGATMHFISNSANGRHWGFGSNFILGVGEFGIYDYSAGANRFMISASGNIGVGNNAPTAKLDVSQPASGSGSFSIGTPPPSGIHGDASALSGFISGVFGTTSSVDGFGVLGENLASGQPTGHSAGVRGITALSTSLGTGVWGDALQTTGDNVGVFGHSASNTGTGVQGLADATTGDAVGVYGRSDSNAGTGVWGEATATSAAATNSYPVAVYGKLASNVGAAGLFDSTSTGNILVGRAGVNPVNVFRVDTTGKVFANGNLQASGADFAESVAVQNTPNDYEPADVLAIDVTGTRRFTLSKKPYSTLIAGVYSTKPGVLGTPHHMDDPRIIQEEIPLAIVGIVPCKVTSENGMIKAGDLLVSSSTAGYAMKGTDRARMTGAVIGKALQAMRGNTDVVEVLVSLQ